MIRRRISSMLPIALGVSMLAGCTAEPEAQQNVQMKSDGVQAPLPEPSGPPILQQTEGDLPATVKPAAIGWTRQGDALRLVGADQASLMVLSCRPGSKTLSVQVPGFTPIDSEDRLSLGLGQEPVTLVADLRPGQVNSGIRAEGQVPENFEALLQGGGQITAVYGAQQVGPFPPIPPEQASAFAKAC